MMTDPIRILFVEDTASDMELACIELQKAGIAVVSKRVDKEEELVPALESFLPNLVICDYSMPRFNGMEALTIIQKQDTSIPVIMFTGSQNEMVAVECMKAGASDYILKDTITRLPFAVKEVLEKRALIEARNRLHEEEKSRAKEMERLNAELTEARYASLNIMADLNAEIEQKEIARGKLAGSEEKFRELVENLNDVIYLISLDGLITYVSPATWQILGYKPSELIGTHFAHLVIPEDVEHIRQAFGSVLKGDITPREYRMLTKSGDVRWVRTSSRPVKAGEKITGLQGVLTDIHERKQAEEELMLKIDELERFNDLTVGREFTMIELKKEVNALLKRLGESDKYKIVG